MQESTEKEPAKRTESEQSADSDATSKETLSDVENAEKVSSGRTKTDVGPSPDGTLDEPDEAKDAGPM